MSTRSALFPVPILSAAIVLVQMFALPGGDCAWALTDPEPASPQAADSEVDSPPAPMRPLTRWRAIVRDVERGAVPASQQRAAALVLAWGQMLDTYLGPDEELRGLLEHLLETPGTAAARLAAALELYDADGSRLADSTGTFFDAYVSPVDGSGQLLWLHVPADYTPGTRYPLEVRPASYVKLGEEDPEDLEAGHFVLRPGMRGQNGVQGLCERDVLDAIAHVQRHYAIDADRIYLSGGSIAGGVIWRLATHYPDLFAALRVDYGWSWNERIYPSNACNLPMWLYHDTVDIWVPVEESRVSAQTLRGTMSPVLYSETSGGGHSRKLRDPSWATDEWLLAQRRERHPALVDYTTTTVRRSRAYWVEILSFGDPNRVARVRARVVPGEAQTQLFLDLDNVEVLGVDLVEALFPADRPVWVGVADSLLRVDTPLPEAVFVQARTESGPRLSTEDPRPGRSCRPYAAGGFLHLYRSGEPLLIVRGTEGDDDELLAAIDRFCHWLSTRQTGWWPFGMEPFAMGTIPVKDDVAVTEADMARCNLIAVGSARTNTVLRRLTGRLPATEKDGELLVGTESYALGGRAYGLHYYNPEAPERLVMVLSSDELAFYEQLHNGVAERSQDELPVGLHLLDVGERQWVRQIAWGEDWQMQRAAAEAPLLPEALADTAAVRKLHLEAQRRAVGADFVLYWKGGPPMTWDPSTARWSDLAASANRCMVLFDARATGTQLLQAPLSDKVKLGVYPEPDPEALVSEAEYRVAADPRLAKAFLEGSGTNLTAPRAVRVDLYEEMWRWAAVGGGMSQAAQRPPR